MIHFLYLPFGLACGQDIFQQRMVEVLDRCDGATGIADGITVRGKDDERYEQCLFKLKYIVHVIPPQESVAHFQEHLEVVTYL